MINLLSIKKMQFDNFCYNKISIFILFLIVAQTVKSKSYFTTDFTNKNEIEIHNFPSAAHSSGNQLLSGTIGNREQQSFKKVNFSKLNDPNNFFNNGNNGKKKVDPNPKQIQSPKKIPTQTQPIPNNDSPRNKKTNTNRKSNPKIEQAIGYINKKSKI